MPGRASCAGDESYSPLGLAVQLHRFKSLPSGVQVPKGVQG